MKFLGWADVAQFVEDHYADIDEEFDSLVDWEEEFFVCPKCRELIYNPNPESAPAILGFDLSFDYKMSLLRSGLCPYCGFDFKENWKNT